MIGMTVLIILIALPVLTVVLWQARAGRRVAELKAAVRARGEPLSPQELAAIYVVPKDREDTTAIWLNAVAALDTEGFRQAAGDLPFVGLGKTEIPPPGQPWPQLAAAEGLLDKYRPSLERLHEAAKREGVARYPLKFEDGFAMTAPHLQSQSLRSGAKLLVLEAHVQAHRGNAHAVVEAIQALNRLGASLEHEPLLFSLLVRIAVDGMSAELCCQMLVDVPFSDEDLGRLSDEYQATRYNEGYYRALLGERAMRMLAFENPQALGNELPHGLLLLSNEDLTQYLQFMAGAITAARKPFPQAQAEFQALEQRLPTASGSRLNKLRCVRTLLLIPTLDAALAATARGNAQSEAAATAIAIEQYRRQQGTLPERLEQLVPEFLPQLPADPFNGQPLRYVMQPDHYLLYSVGQDGVDNGGQTESQRDVVFRVRKTAPDR